MEYGRLYSRDIGCLGSGFCSTAFRKAPNMEFGGRPVRVGSGVEHTALHFTVLDLHLSSLHIAHTCKYNEHIYDWLNLGASRP